MPSFLFVCGTMGVCVRDVMMWVAWWYYIDTEKKREKMAPKTSASNPKVVGKSCWSSHQQQQQQHIIISNRERGTPWEVARPPSAIISTGVRCSY